MNIPNCFNVSAPNFIVGFLLVVAVRSITWTFSATAVLCCSFSEVHQG
jgi:hypothetical protein